jgi:hypothetical protein
MLNRKADRRKSVLINLITTGAFVLAALLTLTGAGWQNAYGQTVPQPPTTQVTTTVPTGSPSIPTTTTQEPVTTTVPATTTPAPVEKLPDVQTIPGGEQAKPSSSDLMVLQRESVRLDTNSPAENVPAGTPIRLPYDIVNTPAQNTSGKQLTNIKVTILVSAKLKITNVTSGKGRVTISGQFVIIEIDSMTPGEKVMINIDTESQQPLANANSAINAIAEGTLDGKKVVISETSLTRVPPPSGLPRTGEGSNPTVILIPLDIIFWLLLLALGSGLLIILGLTRRKIKK